MELLNNPVRAYAWGSRTVIAELLGAHVPRRTRRPSCGWGPTPADPSQLRPTGKSLLDAIPPTRRAAGHRPRGALGRHAAVPAQGAGRRGAAVAAGAPEPRAGPRRVRRRERRGRRPRRGRPQLPRRQPQARADLRAHAFHALVGFRDPAATVPLLRALDVPALAGHAELLAAQPDADGLRALFTTWITLPQSTLDVLVPALQDGCRRGWPARTRYQAEARTVLELSERYPGDAGVLAALLLNRVTLAPRRGAVPARRQPARLPDGAPASS